MELFSSAVVGLVVAVSVLYKGFLGGAHFAPGACQRLQPYLASHMVGQDLALSQLTNAICDHLEAHEAPRKPLIVSLHGPPGVGKSLTHHLLARALYSKAPDDVTDCPGLQCAGYKVLYGMDYVASQREQQHAAVRAGLLEHVHRAPQSLVVVEEYDKLDCDTRGMLRQLLENPAVANISLERSVVLLESNTGYTRLHQLLLAAGGRARVSAEAATKALKDTVFVKWAGAGCEDRSDTAKFMGLVDFFLPYFPLDAPTLRALFERRLAARASAAAADKGLALSWAPGLPDWLVDKRRSPVLCAHAARTPRRRYAALSARSTLTGPTPWRAPRRSRR